MFRIFRLSGCTLLLLALLVQGCSSGGDEPVNADTSDQENDIETPQDPSDPVTPADPTDSETNDPADSETNDPQTDTETGTDSEIENGNDTETENNTNTNTGNNGNGLGDVANNDPNNLVEDLSAGDDDSPTAVETLSLQGPFIKDTTRPYGPPSVPQRLTMLLSGDNWLRFSWAPSTDDQSVEGYEIYRDGVHMHTVRGDTGYEFDYRNWLSTAYMDCDYTHYASCRDQQPSSGASHAYSVVAVDNEGQKSSPSESVVMNFAGRQGSTVNLDGYSQVFADEFDGSELDRNKWKTALPWGENETINGEQQYFVNIFGNNPTGYDPFVFTGSTLQITGIATPSGSLAAANGLPYLSGVLTTADNFEMTYGYVEMNAKLASGEGVLSTFYLFNQHFEGSKPEIDIAEYIGSHHDKVYQTYHYYDSNRARYSTGEKQSTPTMEHVGSGAWSGGFHTYSVLWEPELVIWYIDDVEVQRMIGPRVSNEPMNIITQLVLGSEWIGSPAGSAIPAVLEIDYIRAWQK